MIKDVPSPNNKVVATRAAVLEHVDSFNTHDTGRLLAGLGDDAVWVTGVSTFRGAAELSELFDPGLWAMEPSLELRTLLVDGQEAAAVFREQILLDGDPRIFHIAAFFTVRNGLIQTVKIFREGSADTEP